MSSPIEVVLTILGISFWILFPIGMFLSVSHVDKNTDQIMRFEHHEHDSETEDTQVIHRPVYEKVPFDWHHPMIFFRQWLEHE